MAKINILQWLYKHSPVNFYSITGKGETIIKSINNTFVGYKYNRVFLDEEINNIRKVIKNFKRLSTITILALYFILVYGFVFPYYKLFESNFIKISVIICVVLIPFIVLAIMSKFFEIYLNKKFGGFTKSHFPSSNFIETQSYHDFKQEIAKIIILIFVMFFVYINVGSPYETSVNLIKQGEYEKAIKITTIWSKIIPIDPQWYSLRGYAKFHIGDYKGAIEDYDKTYELKNDEYKSMSFDNKIYIKYILNDYNSALEDFNKEINLTKDSNEKNSLLWDKAQFLYNIGEYKKALDIYNDLITKSVDDQIYLVENRLYFERSQVYKKLGKIKESKTDEQKAKDLQLDIEYQNSIPEPILILEEI